MTMQTNKKPQPTHSRPTRSSNDRQRCELALLQTKADAEAFARKAKVSIGVVAGQFGHYTGNWSRFGKLRESVDLAAGHTRPFGR